MKTHSEICRRGKRKCLFLHFNTILLSRHAFFKNGMQCSKLQTLSHRILNFVLKRLFPLVKAPGRFAQKPVPPGTIRLGLFAQNFERDCSHKITGTVRSKFNLLGQFSLFNFQKEKKNEVEFSSKSKDKGR